MRAALWALAIGLAALAVPPHPLSDRPTWETLLAPYGSGTPFLGGFRIDDVRRGPDNGIVVSVRRPDDGAAVEVLVVERGRWQSTSESPSFVIDYELPRSPAAEREAVTALLADTIRARDTGLPSPDAIPLRAGDPTVLPWWLEMVRGGRGLLFGVGLVWLALIAIHRAGPVCAAGVVLGTTCFVVRLLGVPSWRFDLGGVWMLPAALLATIAALRGRRPRPWPDVAPLAAVTAVALSLRLALGPWGPLHVNGHGARFIAGAAGHPEGIAAYGPGYAELFRVVVAIAPSNPDWAIFAANGVLSALLPALVLVTGVLAGIPAAAALAAATLFAVDPVAIRSGATEAYYTPIAFLCTSAGVATLLAVHGLAEDRRWRATAALLAAGTFLSLAARIHPCAWVLMAITPFVALAATAGDARVRRLTVAMAIFVAGGVLLSTSANALLDVLGNIRTGTIYRPEPPSPWPLAWIVLGATAYGVVTRRYGLALAAGVALVATVATREAFAASWIWEQAYHRLYLPLPLLAVLAPLAPRRRGTAVAAAAVLTLAWVRFAWPLLAVRSTEQLEYRWLRDRIVALPPECRLIYVESANKRFLALPTYVDPARPAVAMDRARPSTIDAALAPAPCIVYVRTSVCSTVEGRPDCDEIERHLTLAPIARAALAVSGEFESFAHDRDPVEVVMARVERVER